MTIKPSLSGIRNAVFDLDGTLLNSKRIISEKNIECLHYLKKNNIGTIFASARLKRDIDGVLPDIFQKCIKVCSNGAVMYSGNKKLYENKLTRAQIDQIVQMIVDIAPCSPICFQEENNIYCSHDLTDIDPDIKYEQISLNNIDFSHCYLIALFISNKISLEKVKQSLPRSCELISNEDGTVVHIHNRGVSKKNALSALPEYYHFNFSSTLAFGDSYNDLDMLKAAGIGVCMSNSCSWLKKQIYYKTKSNDDDGVSDFIDKMLR